MKTTSTNIIDFSVTDERTDWEISSWEATQMVGRYLGIIARNTWRAVDRFVHGWPWVAIIATAIIATVISFYGIGQARAERDKAVGKQYQLQKQVEQYQIISEASANNKPQ